MARIRTILEAHELLKRDDPETRITVHMLRRLIADGTIPSIRSGRVIYLNYDALEEYFSAPFDKQHIAGQNTGAKGIRPVSVRVR